MHTFHQSEQEKLRIVFHEIKRILKPTGVVWLNIGDGYTSGNRSYRAADTKYNARFLKKRPKTPIGLKEKELLGVPWRIAFMLQQEGWYLRTDVVWHKPNSMPESVKDRPNRCHEYLFLFSKSPKYFFNKSSLKDAQGNALRSIWKINNKSSRSTIHSATFPTELVSICLKASTRRNQTVLDPFCGIGTVGIVSSTLERKFIGVEINSQFIKEAKNRLKRNK